MIDAARPWRDRTHAQLAELARELFLAGHLIDRAGMPHALARFGADGMRDIAIDEWMAASPIYTRRMQQLLGFEGDTVATIFKGMQLDIGAPPEFMDFRYRTTDDHHGEFHVAHCGALMDVEPMGDEFVVAMCHHIEDPTFDATATATNARARMRPIHRPPRVHAGSTPHCAWTVTIDPDADPLPVPTPTTRLAGSSAASVALAAGDPDLRDDDGWTTYDGPLDADLVMERFSSATLARIADEAALQGHLLARAYMSAVADRADPTTGAELGALQAAGVGGLVGRRLAAALHVPADLAGLAEVLSVHPLFLPRAHIGLELRLDELDPAELVVSVTVGAAFEDADGLCWPALLVGPHGDGILGDLVAAVVPGATVTRVDAAPNQASWAVHVEPAATPVPLPSSVALAALSTGADFAFERRT